MTPIFIHDPADPRIAAYRDIRERDLTGRAGLFIAEGEVVVRGLASGASLCRPLSLLLAHKRWARLQDVAAALPTGTPVYVAEQAVLDQIAGYPLHRGILALGAKPEPQTFEALVRGAGPADVFVMCCGIGNHDNMGGVFRNAAAFGARAVLLDSSCCDPFYRKAVRVSVGAVLRMPMAVSLDAALAIQKMQAAGVEVLALTPGAAHPLAQYRRCGPVALMLGSEGPGLPPEVIAQCRPIGIPMAGGFDSLNVAATSAVALHHLTTPALSGGPG